MSCIHPENANCSFSARIASSVAFIERINSVKHFNIIQFTCWFRWKMHPAEIAIKIGDNFDEIGSNLTPNKFIFVITNSSNLFLSWISQVAMLTSELHVIVRMILFLFFFPIFAGSWRWLAYQCEMALLNHVQTNSYRFLWEMSGFRHNCLSTEFKSIDSCSTMTDCSLGFHTFDWNWHWDDVNYQFNL